MEDYKRELVRLLRKREEELRNYLVLSSELDELVPAHDIQLYIETEAELEAARDRYRETKIIIENLRVEAGWSETELDILEQEYMRMRMLEIAKKPVYR